MALQGGKVLNEWNAVVNDRDKWKALIQNVCKVHNHACNYDLYPYRITKGAIYMWIISFAVEKNDVNRCKLQT